MSITRVSLCVFGAVLLHAAVMLFGGILFLHEDDAHSHRDVELVTEAVEKDKAEDQLKDEKREELKTDTEAPPDPNQVKSVDMPEPSNDDAPALDAASLSAIENALNGNGGAGSDVFGSGASLASGGRIGGTGKAASGDQEFAGAFNITEIDQRPRATYQVSAGYPAELRAQKLEGKVSLLFIVDENGRVTSPRVEKSTHSAFEAPALDALRQWKFDPAVKSGQRVACRMRVSIAFQPRD